jgi:two-component system CheB/CheR fusion protein
MSKAAILIVEDEGLIAEDLAGKLRRLGYEVAAIASKGEEAVSIAAHVRPDLVLMDISLGGPMDGIQAAEAIRHQHDVPVIYLTAHSDPATLARAKITDPFGYILKPFEQRELATQIELARYKHQADQQLRRQREWLRVTLNSIGDAVIATDAEGRITFVNPVAELLTGWKAEEAAGQPIQGVFRIVNEQTGKALEEPVARVLREGRAVDLANHAALVTRDDRTVPIEDSAAPILDAAGQVIGAVLVFHDVTTKRRAEEELDAAKNSAERAKDAAEHANRAKDHFLAVLSHELRTPLTPVVMGVSMLQDDPNLDPKVRETLEMVHRNIEMEARLIDDLLDVSRIARGKVELSRSQVELCTVLQRAVEVCKPDIEARRLHFGVDLGPDAPYWVDVDAARLQQVFWNLLKNAIKFTPHDGCVGIRCRLDGTHVVIAVNDNGIGIEPEALSRIFNAFEQAERSITRQFGGLGLGLAISKALVEMHEGQIVAESEGRDKGSTFRIRLPLCTPAGRPKSPAPAASPSRAVRHFHILMVEDHGVTAKMMKMVLTREGHTVEMAGDVATAVQLADQQAFDLLMSDLGLPDGSGHDLIRQLRERGHKFPAIALSGYGQEEDIRHSREAGFAAHLTKPASREAVVEAIAAVTAGSG